jgi:hypothetical protein
MRSAFLVVAIAIVALAGCSGVERDITHLQQEQDAISAATKRIKVVARANVKGDPPYTTLGRVQGYCFNLPNSTGGQVVHGDGIRAAAYRMYGSQVDAIVSTNVWFVSDDDFGAFEPYTEGGYFECGGNAVHFTAQPEPVLPRMPEPTS